MLDSNESQAQDGVQKKAKSVGHSSRTSHDVEIISNNQSISSHDVQSDDQEVRPLNKN